MNSNFLISVRLTWVEKMSRNQQPTQSLTPIHCHQVLPMYNLILKDHLYIVFQDDSVRCEWLPPPFHGCYDLFLRHVIVRDAFFHAPFFLLFVFFLLVMNFDLQTQVNDVKKKNKKKKQYVSKVVSKKYTTILLQVTISEYFFFFTQKIIHRSHFFDVCFFLFTHQNKACSRVTVGGKILIANRHC